MKEEIYKEYCTGCGLCNSVFGTELKMDTDGFSKAELSDERMIQFCEQVCPANGKHLLTQEGNSWGKYVGVYESYAGDKDIRYKSASGGNTTAVALYMLETGMIDGVIQTGASDNPFETKVYCSTTREDVIANCASRYITSSPLKNFTKIIEDNKRYCFIGRPCDAVVLRNFLEIEPQYKDNIVCILSFFCAGAPSEKASHVLVERMGIRPEEVLHIQYRGNGWPGKVTVRNKSGKEYNMEYIDSWNNILGRDIRKICKFCTDGVGESADISNGDFWYLDSENKPVFKEKDGRNVTFSRNEKGDEILKGAAKAGYISLISHEGLLDELAFIQPNHAVRKKILYSRCLAMKVMHRLVPNYDIRKLKIFAQERGRLKNMKTFVGTIKRVIEDSL